MLNINYGKLTKQKIEYLRLPIRLSHDITIDSVIHPAGAWLSTTNKKALLQLGYKSVVEEPAPDDAINEYWKETETEIIRVWENQAEYDTRMDKELRQQGIYEITVPPAQILNAITENCMNENPCTLCVTDIKDTIAWGGSKEADGDFEAAGITANKNTVPNDPQSPFVTSGVRLGSAAVTTRGFKEEDMIEVGKIIAGALTVGADDEVSLKNLRERSLRLCSKYPLYEEV